MNQPQTAKADEFYALARDCLNKGQFDAAEKFLDQSLKAQPTAQAWRGMGMIHRARGQAKEAAACLDKSLQLDGADHKSLALRAEVFFDTADVRQAIGHYVLAIEHAPAVAFYLQRFIAIAGRTPFAQHNAAIETALLACLAAPGVDCAGAQILWYTTLTRNPEFAKFYHLDNSGAYPVFDVAAFEAADWQLLTLPFFLRGLEKIVVCDTVFEEFLTHLRRRLLEELDTPSPRLPRADIEKIANALAQYSFFTEFIFSEMPEETEKVLALRKTFETDKTAMKDAALVALYACYAPLSGLKTANDIAWLHAQTSAAGVIACQIAEPAALAQRRAALVAITPIDDEISQQVQGQYEEFPYPRWKSFSTNMLDEEVRALKGQCAKILNAGCGTGREAIQLAAAFPDAEVLAVDLSRTSLAYATGRAEELGIRNVAFRQADILNLSNIGVFDFISSSGVLHHMADPLAGWRVLCGLLKPGGHMRIGLYSRHARRYISEARQEIAKGGYANDAADMKRFRAQSRSLFSRAAMDNLEGMADYYYLSMYRDLLFHVQEHVFDVPEISRALDTLGLQFISFGFASGIPQQYTAKFPQDPAGGNLANWDAYEKEYPDTFAGMYHIWCRKKA